MTANPTSPTSPADALREVTEQVGYIRVLIGDSDDPGDGDWARASELVHDPSGLYAAMRATADGRGIARDDIGMSLLVQSYAFRIASAVVGTWLVSGGVIDVSPGIVSIQFARNRPNAVRLDRVEWAVPPPERTTLDVHRHLIDDHLAVLVDTAHRACRVGSRLLWSNVATSCASSFGAFMRSDNRVRIRERAGEFFTAARPELVAGGDVVPVGPTWAWQRHACCLLYQHGDSAKCSDCSLLSDTERRDRYARILAESGAEQ